MDLPSLPEKHEALIELEERQRAIRTQRQEIEAKLAQIESAEAETDLDDLAAIAQVTDPRADLQRQVDALDRAGRKTRLRLVAENERHARQVVKTFRPAHKAAARRILAALEELVEASAAELEVRAKCPVPLVNIAVPHIGNWTTNHMGIARYWRDHCERLGFFEDDQPEPKPAPKAKRRLLAGRGNGAAEPASLAAAGSKEG